MNTILAILKKELIIYFHSPLAYIFIALFLFVSNAIFFYLVDFFLIKQASMIGYFFWLQLVLCIFIPALSMRLFAEEKKMGTLELILTNPIKEINLIIGKFKSVISVMLIVFILSLALVFSVNYLGTPDNGMIFSSYIASLLLSMVFTSISLYFSSMTDNQIIAFIISVAVCMILFFIGYVADALPSFIGYLAGFISTTNHFLSMTRGVIDSRDVIYYLSLIIFFLFLTLKNLEKRKYQ